MSRGSWRGGQSLHSARSLASVWSQFLLSLPETPKAADPHVWVLGEALGTSLLLAVLLPSPKPPSITPGCTITPGCSGQGVMPGDMGQ